MKKPLRLIRPAAVGEAEIAVSIWAEAANWQKENGHPHWHSSDFPLEMAQERSRAGELVFGFDDNIPCACMLIQTVDPIFWPEKLAGSALYLHRLAVRRTYAHHGWGGALIEWAAKQAANLGVPLRLDCAPRARLMNLYSFNGFLPVDEGPVERGGFTVVRYERPCS
jgi:GNAT superfamily N-acetyltransferase